MSDHDDELNQIMEGGGRRVARSTRNRMCDEGCAPCAVEEDSDGVIQKYEQWTTGDDKIFVPASRTIKELPPGCYEIMSCPSMGIYFQRIPVRTEGLLRFPQTNSERVIKEIQKFWDREKWFRMFGLTYKRGIVLWGPPGCHAKGTLVRMYDGREKKVEDVVAGDLLMGPDSRPRKVLELKRGRDEMFCITPTKGEPFVVNAQHVLHLEHSRTELTRETWFPKSLDITVAQYLSLSKWKQSRYKLAYTGVEYCGGQELPLDPYFLGTWLGDGSNRGPRITNTDEEVIRSVYEYAAKRSLKVSVAKYSEKDCADYCLVGDGTKNGNNVMNDLRKLGVIGNKHIPLCYMTSPRRDRLSLLAGLIDTDGHYSNRSHETSGHKGSYEITQKSERLAQDIVSLGRSLGFLTTIRPVVKSIKSRNFEGKYWRVNISGDLSCVPMKISKKRSIAGRPNKNNLRTGIKKVESCGESNFYGFSLDEDSLYLTADYMVHHNSGKSCTIQIIMADVVSRDGVVVKFTHPKLFIEGMRILRQIQLRVPVVVLMEDMDSIIESYSESDVLNILDGVDQVERMVFLATTNYPERLGPRIINRPSRFDKRFKIDHPNAESRRMYLEHIMKGGDDIDIDLDRWVRDTDKFSMAHLKELFVAVVILGDDYEKSVKSLRSMKEFISSEHDRDCMMGFNHSTREWDNAES